MGFAFVEAAETVGAEGLHDADVDVSVVMADESFAVHGDKFFERAKIVVEKLLAEVGREIGFGVVEERGDIVLESASAAALIVDEIRLAVTEQDVAGLEVAVEKIIARGAEEEFDEAGEVLFEGMFVEGDAGEAKEIVFEVVQIPGDGLAIEAGDGIADVVVEVAAGFDLKAGKDGDDFAVGLDHFGSDGCADAIFGEEFEEGGVAEVFLEIRAVVQVLGVDFGDRQAVAAKVFGEFEEGGVLFADAVEDADGAGFFIRETDDFAAGAAEFSLEGLDARGRRVKVLFEERFENVDGHGFRGFRFDQLIRFRG
jgi:hypothetical protein